MKLQLTNIKTSEVKVKTFKTKKEAQRFMSNNYTAYYFKTI